MKAIYNNLINGNLSDARRLASNVGLTRLTYGLKSIGLSFQKAHCAARYLKGVGTFQDYADAK